MKYVIALMSVLFFQTLFVSCAQDKKNVLLFDSGEQVLPLYALNENAKKAFIRVEKSSSAYFAFTNYVADSQNALSLLFEPVTSSGNLRFGFLFESDFIAKNRLKEEIPERSAISLRFDEKHLMRYDGENKKFLLSLQMPSALEQATRGQVFGFFVQSDVSVAILSAFESLPFFGWKYEQSFPSYGSFSGGTAQTDFQAMDFSLIGDERGEIVFFFDEIPEQTNPKNQSAVKITVAGEDYHILLAPQLQKITIHTSQLKNFSAKNAVVSANHALRGMIFEQSKAMSTNFLPIVADPGLILLWNQQTWRQPDFEVFSWEHFPSLLFFDIKNYAIQDNFFKRLAFFVEKGGYRGKLVTLQEIAHLHAFNAHDYRAESLASFFDKARKENFVLTNEEKILQQILFEQGIIVQTNGKITAGEGAVISISRESPAYLRQTFIVHEGLHGLFFINEDFQKTVEAEFNRMDKTSLQFLLQYFSVTPSLNYDLTDTYLIQNEFMSYVLQQHPLRTQAYFIKTLATRQYINRAHPELVKYLLQTNADAYSKAAENLSGYLFKKWGYYGGRISLVSK